MVYKLYYDDLENPSQTIQFLGNLNKYSWSELVIRFSILATICYYFKVTCTKL